ncbi:EF-hand domain-containing protein [Croceivirga thetidis]|uniref:EF-hand domain-containing protein n=1 Tax=Croceivirga thetidis TaxID=2721623 RepID=A0ABX1GLB3_9FLAO|nr:EF-hand domain-containing protein [Croceivirga thetidis]NKI30379.1 EF-hand domain-containing protein [Croceivirga thetidis]
MKTKAILTSIVISTICMISVNAQQSNNRERRQPPSIDKLFEHMDKNEDGFLSEEEVKGPLKEMFAKIDANEDGLLSREEIEKAPKPERRDRPNRN